MGKEGDAVLHMMRNLELERLALAAMSLGIARRCIEVMNSYANERTAFGSPLADFGQIQRHIADSYAEYQAGRAYVYSVASQLNLDAAGNRVDSDGVKLYCAVRRRGSVGCSGFVSGICSFGCPCPAGYGQERRRSGHAIPWWLRVRVICCCLLLLASRSVLFDSLRWLAVQVRRGVPRGAAVEGLKAAGDRRRHQRGAPKEHDPGHEAVDQIAVNQRNVPRIRFVVCVWLRRRSDLVCGAVERQLFQRPKRVARTGQPPLASLCA